MKRNDWIALLMVSAALVIFALVVSVAPPAQSATVNLGLTLPLFRADSTNCQVASTDTLKDLNTVAAYVSTTSALLDSTLVSSGNVAGMQGKPYNFSTQQPTWSTRWYWAITRDVLDHRACKSNVWAVTVTGGPPARITDLHTR